MPQIKIPPTEYQLHAIEAATLVKREGKPPTAVNIAKRMSERLGSTFTATGVGVSMANAKHRGLVTRTATIPPEWHPVEE